MSLETSGFKLGSADLASDRTQTNNPLTQLLLALEDAPSLLETTSESSKYRIRPIEAQRISILSDLKGPKLSNKRRERNRARVLNHLVSKSSHNHLTTPNTNFNLKDDMSAKSAFQNMVYTSNTSDNKQTQLEFGSFPTLATGLPNSSPVGSPFINSNWNTYPQLSHVYDDLQPPSLKNLILFSTRGPESCGQTAAQSGNVFAAPSHTLPQAVLPSSLASTLAITRAAALSTPFVNGLFAYAPHFDTMSTNGNSFHMTPTGPVHFISPLQFQPNHSYTPNQKSTQSNITDFVQPNASSSQSHQGLKSASSILSNVSKLSHMTSSDDQSQSNCDTTDTEPSSASSTASVPTSPNYEQSQFDSTSASSSEAGSDDQGVSTLFPSQSPALLPGCGMYRDYIMDLRSVCPECSAAGRLKSKKKPLVDSLLLLAFFGDGIKRTPNGEGYVIDDSNLARELMNNISSQIRPPSRGTNNSYENWKRAMGKTFRKSGTFFTPKDDETTKYAKHVEEHLTKIFESKKVGSKASDDLWSAHPNAFV